MNTNIKVIGLTQLRIKPESAAREADALITQPSEPLKVQKRIYANQTMLTLTQKSQHNLFLKQGNSKLHRILLTHFKKLEIKRFCVIINKKFTLSKEISQTLT